MSLLAPFAVVGAVAFVLTALFTEAMRRIALKCQLMDVPGKAKGHRAPTPYLGGAAIVMGALAAWAVAVPPRDPQVLTLILTGIIISLLGLADDIRPLRVSVRLSIEFLAAAAVVASGAQVGVFGSVHGIGNWCDIAITVLWIVLMTNSFNLLDNSDGAAGSIATVTAAALAVLAFGAGSESIAVFLLAVSASCAGFLIHNWAPARIFMGDAGSLFLGFVTSAAAVLVFGLHNGSVPPTSWADRASGLLLLTFVAAVDTGTVVVSRYRAGRPLMQGGADHISHRLRVLGLRTSQAAALLSAVAGISCIFAFLVTFGTLPAVGSLTVVLTAGITVVVLAQWVPLEGRALLRSAPPGMPVRTVTSSPPAAQAAARPGRRVSGG